MSNLTKKKLKYTKNYRNTRTFFVFGYFFGKFASFAEHNRNYISVCFTIFKFARFFVIDGDLPFVFFKIDSVFHTVIEPNICVLSAESAWQVDFNIETD